MILKGNARGGAKDLALHLMKQENEHVELHELRGFASQTLIGAFNEAYAISCGTNCKQFLYSLSLNPPQTENVPIESFESAIGKVEQQLGLTDQPRAIIFHEKEGRRHAHCVWSRINVNEMKAVQLSYDRNQLKQVSRELFLEHGWKMPEGLSDSRKRDPSNYTLGQWQQAKRIGQNAKDIKRSIQDAWAICDNRESFIHALEERGFKLACGNKSRFVAVDMHGEVYAIARQLDSKMIRTKQIKERLGDPKNLPDVIEAHQLFSQEMQISLTAMQERLNARNDHLNGRFEKRRTAMVQDQRQEREAFRKQQDKRRLEEALKRQSRFRKGLGGVWDRLRGEHKRIRALNEVEAVDSVKRDRSEKHQLTQKQLSDRGRLNLFRLKVKQTYQGLKQEIEQDRQTLKRLRDGPGLTRQPRKPRSPTM